MDTRCLVSLAVALSLVACSDDFRDDPLPAPLAVRVAFPAEGAVVPPEPPVGVSITFTRPLSSLGEVRLSLVPPADSGTVVLSPTGRTVTWEGVRPDAPLQHLLLDSRSMRQPFVLAWRTSGDIEVGAVTGVVRTPDLRYPAESAVVFALGADSGFNAADPRSFVRADPTAVGVGTWSPDQEPGEVPVTLRLPALGDQFHLVAILDTNRDLIYDPTEDWNGIHGHWDGPVTVTAGLDAFEIEIDRP